MGGVLTATVTLLFCDLVESTALASDLGDAAADRVRHEIFDALRAEVIAHRGIDSAPGSLVQPPGTSPRCATESSSHPGRSVRCPTMVTFMAMVRFRARPCADTVGLALSH